MFDSSNKNNLKKENSIEFIIRHNPNIVDNMILSHLSTKRKEFNHDRMRKIFEKFDKQVLELKKK